MNYSVTRGQHCSSTTHELCQKVKFLQDFFNISNAFQTKFQQVTIDFKFVIVHYTIILILIKELKTI